MDDWLYYNGRVVKSGDAFISARDRGFRFGDGVFETIPFYDGKPYQWDFHLERLQDGLNALFITPPKLDFLAESQALIAQNGLTEGFIRIAISRGVGSKGYLPLEDISPTVVIETLKRSEAPFPRTLWLSTWRKPPAACLPVAVKTAQGLNSTLALLQAQANGCGEALLLSHDDMLCEAASGNLFWIQGGALYTPSLLAGCLKGATRHALMRLYRAQEVTAPLAALKEAEAVFLTNCNWGLLPITQLQPQGWQWRADHPLLASLQKLYQDDIRASV